METQILTRGKKIKVCEANEIIICPLKKLWKPIFLLGEKNHKYAELMKSRSFNLKGCGNTYFSERIKSSQYFVK